MAIFSGKRYLLAQAYNNNTLLSAALRYSVKIRFVKALAKMGEWLLRTTRPDQNPLAQFSFLGGAWVAQWVRSLDLTTHTSLSPIQCGFKTGFVNYNFYLQSSHTFNSDIVNILNPLIHDLHLCFLQPFLTTYLYHLVVLH